MLAAVAVVVVWWLVPTPVAERSGPVSPVRVAVPTAPVAAMRPGAGKTARTGAPERNPAGGRPLFAYVDPVNAAELNRVLPAPARVVRYVRIDRRQIEAKQSPFWRPGGRVQLPLPDGRVMSIVIDDSEMLGADRFTSLGHIAGDPRSRAIFAYDEGYLNVSVDTEHHSFALRPADETVSQFYQVDPAMLPPCGGARHPQIDATVLAEAAAEKARDAAPGALTPGATPATAADANPQAPEIDMLMLYTPEVRSNMTGAARVAALQSDFDAAVAKVNAELAASQVSARVKLVKIAETPYNENASAPDQVQNDALTALSTPNDGKMDEVQALRDQVGADVVFLALNRADQSSIGLSYVLDTPAAVDPSAAATNPLFAFAVVQYGDIAGTDVVPHEFGHLLGCAHARGDPGATGTKDGAYTYSYGYRFYGADGRQYHDIMAYQPGIGLSYYSNPDVVVGSPVNEPIGILPGYPGESDCALTINEDAFEVSTYRLQTDAAPAGTLVNVSTRAYVGANDRVLIGGFVVNGTQPKQVLIRAAGPALTAYGVTDPLAHPVLELHSSTSLIASNQGWSNQPSAGDIATAAANVGAFPFAAGSPDDALLVTLNPGAYTAVVKSGDGTEGTALVEVYDVNRTGNRIINLSTRGYAATGGRQMIGGFAVQGSPGTTKRVLIRVLGPTLAKSYGITDAMDDPMMELHDASGNLLIKNDDWSSGDTAGTASAANDFSPSVTSYSEKEIAATGLAPSNRREPCVMVDLPPGNYSVIAEPFEDLGSTPPQPAQPGVALVEVYEINP